MNEPEPEREDEKDENETVTEAPRTVAVRVAPAESQPTPAPPSEESNLAELVRIAARIDWEHAEIECPPAFVEVVGAELVAAHAVIRCDCGVLVRLALDGQSIAGCPRCKARYRHLLVVQGENWAADGCAHAIAAIIAAQLDDGT